MQLILTLLDELCVPAATPMAAGKSWVFGERSLTVGRVEGNDLVLPVAHISSRHLTIRFRSGRYEATDLGSTNGSLVRRHDQPLLLGPRGATEIELESGDLLVLGDIEHPVRLQVELKREVVPAQWGHDTVAVVTRGRGDTLAISQRLRGSDALQAIVRLVEATGAARDRDEILARVTEATLNAIPGAADVLVVVRGPGGVLQMRAEAHCGAGISRLPDTAICEQVLAGEVALLFGQHGDASLPADTLVDQGVGSGIAAPMWGEGETAGVLQINCGPGASLQAAHLDLAVVLAHHAAVALERADLITRLQLAEQRLREENAVLRRSAQPEVQMVAVSPAMQGVMHDLGRAAATNVTVLIQGETGTGKEVAARWLHGNSARARGLLVPVNCGALTETLLDSELFGHRKGAFTGATASRKGVFEMAEGGTVLLDEIGETPGAVQVRLLRVLEEGMVKPVGEVLERKVDVRIIAATNRDLAALVEQGRFRLDLFYRLRVFPIMLPPLRQRTEDIEPLCRLFIRRYASQVGKVPGPLAPRVLQALQQYGFPGNIRELANEIERAVVRVEPGEPLTADLFSEEIFPAGPAAMGEVDAPSALRDQMDRVERQIIEAALGRHGGGKVATARELGLTRQGLAKKMHRLGL